MDDAPRVGSGPTGGPETAEDYRGPATLTLDDDELTVRVRLSSRFEPVEGRMRWAGRTEPDDDLRRRVGEGLRTALITVPGGGQRSVRLGEPDPWGGVRLSGTGNPPWAGPAA
jgi:Domain of unknown function (DUF4873)